MERSDVWTCLYEGYASKPRPVLIVQDNAVSGQFGSTVMCLITSFVSDDIPTRQNRAEPCKRTSQDKLDCDGKDHGCACQCIKKQSRSAVEIRYAEGF